MPDILTRSYLNSPSPQILPARGTSLIFPSSHFFVAYSLESLGKVWRPFLLHQLSVSRIPNPRALRIGLAALPYEATFVCHGSEGCSCARKEHRLALALVPESEKDMDTRPTPQPPFVNLWTERREGVDRNGVTVTVVRTMIVHTKSLALFRVVSAS